MKIGDFGLATRDLFRNTFEEQNLAECSAEKTKIGTTKRTTDGRNDGTPSGFTKDVGTTMYIAPEIERHSAVSTKFYTSKIDVFR